MSLGKVVCVLPFVNKIGEQVIFANGAEKTAFYRAVRFDAETWRDMGEPKEVTLTVEPGDTLNP